MAKRTITGKNYETVEISTSKTTVSVAKGALVYAGGTLESAETDIGKFFAIAEDISRPGINGNTYNIDGQLKGLYGGIYTFGVRTTINITANAELHGLYQTPGSAVGVVTATGAASTVKIAAGAEISSGGIVIAGDGSIATNSGHIFDAMTGMQAGGAALGDDALGDDGMKLVNNGKIEALFGMVSTADAALTNGAKGEIIAFATGMTTQGGAIVNHGTIRILLSGEASSSLPLAAIYGGDAAETVTNDGSILGNIYLGEGNDRFNGVGGTIKGSVYGGDGDDTFTIDRSVKIVEAADEGTDTVRSSVNYQLAANVEKLVLTGKADIKATGNAGDNDLAGNAGDNVLKGMGGADVFHFATKGGHDTIADFVIGTDVIDLSKWTAMTDLATVLSHASNKGDDMVITLGKDTLTIIDHHKADFVSDSDFIFA